MNAMNGAAPRSALGQASGSNGLDELMRYYEQKAVYHLWQDQYRCDNWATQATDSRLANSLITCNTTVKLFDMDDPKWTCDYASNQDLDFQQMNICVTELKTRNLCHTQSEIDRLKMEEMCGDAAIMAEFERRRARSLADLHDKKVRSFIACSVPQCNRGNNIGGAIKLGDSAAPFILTPYNVFVFLGMLQEAYEVRNIKGASVKRMVRLPVQVKSLLMSAPRVWNTLQSAGAGVAMSGFCELPMDIGCSGIIFDNCATTGTKDAARPGYTMYPFEVWDKRAISFASGRGISEIVDDPRSYKKLFKAVSYHGIVAQRKEGLFSGVIAIKDSWVEEFKDGCCPN